MKLSDKSIKDFNELLEIYDGFYFNKRGVEDVFDILNDKDMFNNSIKTSYSNELIPNTDLNTGIIYYNYDSLVEYVNEKVDSIYDKCVSNKYKIRNLTNFYMLYTLFHEVNHFDQLLLSEKENFIGKYYKEIITKTDNIKGLKKLLYNNFGSEFAFERSANLISLNELNRLNFNNDVKDILDANYLYHLTDGYKTYPKLLSPSERTLKFINSKKFSLENNLPYYIRVIHGLPLNINELDYLIDVVNKGKNLEETKKLILKK